MNPVDWSDRELHERLVAREPGALSDVYQRFGKSVFRTALAVTRNPHAAEDVTQLVMIAFWNYPERFRPDLGSLGAWLVLKARGRSVDRVRSDAAARSRERRASSVRPTYQPSTEDQVESRWAADWTRKVLADLPERERIPIALAYAGGLTYDQVAYYLGLPEGTVKSQIRTGLRRMAARSSAVRTG